MKLQNGKNYDLVPDALGHSIATQDQGSRDALQKALSESMDAMEKATTPQVVVGMALRSRCTEGHIRQAPVVR
jgi:hypothetical protein